MKFKVGDIIVASSKRSEMLGNKSFSEWLGKSPLSVGIVKKISLENKGYMVYPIRTKMPDNFLFFEDELSLVERGKVQDEV